MLDLRFAPDAQGIQLKDYIKDWPGAFFEKPEPGVIGPRRWIIPIEYLSKILQKAHELKIEPVNIEFDPADYDAYELKPLPAIFKQPQIDAFKEAIHGVASTGAWLINLAMRMGKTGTAIEVFKQLDLTRILVICPAMVRRQWERDIAFWWPERANDVFVWEPNPSKAKLAAGVGKQINIVSYGMVSKLPQDFEPEGIIGDEIHYIQGPKTKQTKEVMKLSARCPDALRLGLTGTVVTTHIESMYMPLHWLWPDRWGKLGTFKFYYMNATPNYDANEVQRGFSYSGLNPAHTQELKDRLKAVSTRKTKLDYPGLFPKLDVQLIEADDIQATAKELAETCKLEGENVAIMSYERSWAEYYGKELGCEVVSGEDVASKRDKIIEALRAAANSGSNVIASATISSTSTGLNLSFIRTFIYTQLSHKIYELIQSFARGHVMDGQPVNIMILYNESTLSIAQAVKRKADAINAVIDAGVEEAGLASALDKAKEKGFTEEEWKEACAMLANDGAFDVSEIT